jgi:chromosome segregation ATPase
MLLDCSCGKMFRVRDGTSTPPTKCPSCGGTLRQASGPPAQAAPASAPAAPGVDTGRVRELEAKLAELEKSASAARSAAELKSQELEEMAGRLAQTQKGREEAGQEATRARAEAQKKEPELKEKLARIQALEKDVQEARAKAQGSGLAAIKEKDAELHYAQERIAALERELQGAQGGTKTRDRDLIDSRARIAALERELLSGKEDSLRDKEVEHKESQEAIARLGEELKKAQDAYKTTLANKEKEIEELHAKVDRAPGDTGTRQAPPDFQRAQARIAMLEKIVQDGEQRYRSLQEEFHKSTESAHSSTAAGSRAMEERDARIIDLEAAVKRNKVRAEELQRQLDAGAAERQSLQEKLGKKESTAPSGEAKYLAADLDRSLASVSSMLQGLVERVKRLNQSLANPEGSGGPAVASAPAPTWGRPVEASRPAARPEPEEETKDDLPAVSDSPAEGEEAAEAVELESLPDEVAAPVDDGGLPQDETLLDMGGAGRKIREELKRKPARPVRPEPPPAPEEGEPEVEEAPLSAETTAGPIPEEEAPPAEGEAVAEAESEQEPPKKKGLFGKLFGRKK